MMTLEEIAELQERLDGETALTARDLEALHQLDFAQIKGVYAARALADLIERAESDPSITDADIDRARWTDKTWTITEHVLHCRLIEFDEARGIYR